MVVNISVHDGHIAEGFREQPPLTSVLVERWYISPGVQRIDIREKGLQGTLFIPPGARFLRYSLTLFGLILA